MKTILLVAGASAIIIGGGVAVSNHYDQNKKEQHAAQISVANQAKQAQLKADLKVQAVLEQTNQTLKAECVKGVAAYAKLPLSIQKYVPKPVCT